MLLGIVIIFLGILFLLENIIPSFAVDFQIVWPILLIVFSLAGIIKSKKLDIFTSIILIIGIWYLLYHLGMIQTQLTEVFWPVLLIIFGTCIIWNACTPQKGKKVHEKKGNMLSYYGIFSGIEEKASEEIERGANIYAIFGGVDLDISKVELKKDITINTYSIFGGTDLKTPENVNVKVNASALFGSNENKRNTKEKKGNKTIYINCISIFGGTEIK